MSTVQTKFGFDVSKQFDYEAYYMLWNDPRQQISMMFRYVLLKTPSAEQSQATVWGCFWDRNIPENNVEFIKRVSLEEMSISEDGTHLKIADSGVFKQKMWGDICTQDKSLSWEMNVDESTCVAVDRFPDLAKYPFFPLFSSSACKCKLNGWVKVNGKEYQVENVDASDGHYSNLQNLKSWNWGNCVNFKEDNDFFFEGISARFNEWTTPSLWAVFSWKGKMYPCNILDSMFINRETKSELNVWEFSTEKDGCRFYCAVDANPQDMILLVHPLPDGGNLYTTITTTANMTVHIEEQDDRGDWKKVKTLTAEKTATFEVTKPIRNPAVTREFKIV